MKKAVLILLASICLLSCRAEQVPLLEGTGSASTNQSLQTNSEHEISAQSKSDDGSIVSANLKILMTSKDKLLIWQKHEYFSVGPLSAISTAKVPIALKLKVTVNEESIPIPASAVLGLAFPNAMNVSVDNDLILVSITGSTGASSWKCTLQIKEGVLIKKTLVDGAFGGELMEQTKYSFPIFD